MPRRCRRLVPPLRCWCCEIPHRKCVRYYLDILRHQTQIPRNFHGPFTAPCSIGTYTSVISGRDEQCGLEPLEVMPMMKDNRRVCPRFRLREPSSCSSAQGAGRRDSPAGSSTCPPPGPHTSARWRSCSRSSRGSWPRCVIRVPEGEQSRFSPHQAGKLREDLFKPEHEAYEQQDQKLCVYSAWPGLSVLANPAGAGNHMYRNKERYRYEEL